MHRQLAAAVDEGARQEAGGTLPEGDGWYYPASLLDGVSPDMAVFRRPLPGPLAAVVRVRNEEDIVSLCRGLGPDGTARIWTRELARGEQLARRLPFDRCLVNPDPGRTYPPGMAAEEHFNIKAFCRMRSLRISV
ncbi:hypothetical protein CGX12_05735 [Zobellella denitrificans]|nr:hypothetical protein CGX12_05735 [Zobellella denitrificans]